MSVVKKVEENKVENKKMGLLVENPVYKPFRYPWCYDSWLTQQRIHWLPERQLPHQILLDIQIFLGSCS